MYNHWELYINLSAIVLSLKIPVKHNKGQTDYFREDTIENLYPEGNIAISPDLCSIYLEKLMHILGVFLHTTNYV